MLFHVLVLVLLGYVTGGLHADVWWVRAALLLFFVLLFRFLAQLPDNPAPSTVKGQIFMDILIVTVTVIVVAIPGMCWH